MNKATYQHKVCGKLVTIEFPSYQGHILTEEALALDKAIKRHKCPKTK